jgi:hypothetical protein
MDTSATTHLIFLDLIVCSRPPSIAAGKPWISLPMSVRSPSGPMPSGKETRSIALVAAAGVVVVPAATAAARMRAWLKAVLDEPVRQLH